MTRFDATYILPIKQSATETESDLSAYLGWLTERLEVIVVDASAPAVFFENDLHWQNLRHVQPSPAFECQNGKVWGVLTGLELATHDRVIIGDDDVRYDDASLAAVLVLLDSYEVVRPQNYFEPSPWHALWDSGRSLLNRLSGGDWPGTLAVRRSVLARTGGYDGDCLFENFELVRTVKTAGGREAVAIDLFVRRRPSSARHFWSQRVRQAYDEFARPRRLLFQLTWLPLQILSLAKRPLWLVAGYTGLVVLAEAGRWRKDGRQVFPFAASLAAPLWVIERSTCSWLAVASRLVKGGVSYRGAVMARAASSTAELEARLAREGATP